MIFKDFIEDEAKAEKKRKEIENIILKAVKPKLIDTTSANNVTVIKFRCDVPKPMIETIYEIIVTLDYNKKIYKGMQRAVYINISKETPNHRNTNYITIEIDRISDVEYAQTLDYLKNYFTDLVKESKVSEKNAK